MKYYLALFIIFLTFPEYSLGQTSIPFPEGIKPPDTPPLGQVVIPSRSRPGGSPPRQRADAPWHERKRPTGRTRIPIDTKPGGLAYEEVLKVSAEENWDGREANYELSMSAAPGYEFCNSWYEDSSRNPLQDPIYEPSNYTGLRLVSAGDGYMRWQMWIKPHGNLADQKKTWISGWIVTIWARDDLGDFERQMIGCRPIPIGMGPVQPFQQPDSRPSIVWDSRPEFHWNLKAICNRGNYISVTTTSYTSCEDARRQATEYANKDQCTIRDGNNYTIRVEHGRTGTCR